MISRPVEEVFRFFLDFDQNAATMEPNVESVAKVPAGPTRSGTTFCLRQKLFGKMREATVTFVSVEVNRKIEIEASLGPISPSGPITFDQADGGTRVVLQHNPAPSGLLNCSLRFSHESLTRSGTRGRKSQDSSGVVNQKELIARSIQLSAVQGILSTVRSSLRLFRCRARAGRVGWR
jgi:hypothetical protein